MPILMEKIMWYNKVVQNKTSRCVHADGGEKEGNLMKALIENNEMAVADMEVSAKGKIADILVVRKVRPQYIKDAEGKITDKIEAVRYDCVDPETYASITLKVLSTHPVVTNEMIELSEEAIYISIPVEETIIRPYEIKFGKAKVSIIVPFVKIAEN